MSEDRELARVLYRGETVRRSGIPATGCLKWPMWSCRRRFPVRCLAGPGGSELAQLAEGMPAGAAEISAHYEKSAVGACQERGQKSGVSSNPGIRTRV